MSKNHRVLAGPDQLHKPYAWIVANEAARLALTGLDESMIGHLCREGDTGVVYQLRSPTGPVWERFNGPVVSLTPQAGAVPRADENGKLDAGWIEMGDDITPSGYVQYLTPGSYSFTVPEGVAAVFVELQGGGAGGGGNIASGGAGGTSSFGAYASATGGTSGNGSADLGSNGSTVGCPVLLRPKFVNNDGAANPSTGRRGGAGSNYGSGGYRSQDPNTSNGGPVGAGGRGAGGGASTSGTSGGAGGNGIGLVTGLTPGAVIPVTVGAGGNGGSYGPYYGGKGGDGFVRIWW